MRIVFASGCAPPCFSRGGAEISAETLVRSLAARGHEVTVVGSLDNYIFTEARDLVTAAERLKSNGVSADWQVDWRGSFGTHLPNRATVRYSVDNVSVIAVDRDVHVPDALSEHLKQNRADIVLTQLSQSHRVCDVARTASLPTVMLLPSLEMTSTHPDAFEAIQNNADAIRYIAPSDFIANTLLAIWGQDCAVIAPAIDHSRFTVPHRPANNVRNVLLVNPQPKKGLRTFVSLAKIFPQLRFVTVDTWFGSVWPVVQCLSSLKNVELLPMRDHAQAMPALYAQCDVLLAPSECDEAFGRVVVEAQYSGLAVLATNRGGIAEALGDGGILMGPDASLNDWSNALARVVEDLDHRTNLIELGRKSAQRFRLDTVIDRYEELLSSLFLRRRRRER
ncbi:glycosyltransferase [Rhizobium ruizarguesonis]